MLNILLLTAFNGELALCIFVWTCISSFFFLFHLPSDILFSQSRQQHAWLNPLTISIDKNVYLRKKAAFTLCHRFASKLVSDVLMSVKNRFPELFSAISFSIVGIAILLPAWHSLTRFIYILVRNAWHKKYTFHLFWKACDFWAVRSVCVIT